MAGSGRAFLMIQKVKLALMGLFTLLCLFSSAPLQRAALAAVVDDPDAAPVIGGACQPKGSFLGLTTWYAYLPGKEEVAFGETEAKCIPQICDTDANGACKSDGSNSLIKIWLIGLAVVEMLLRLGGVFAVFMVVVGGFRYITSQGNPESTKAARGTIVNAFIGMVITIVAAVGVNFIARLLQ